MNDSMQDWMDTFVSLMIEGDKVYESVAHQFIFVTYQLVPATFPQNFNYVVSCINSALQLDSQDIIVFLPNEGNNFQLVKNILDDCYSHIDSKVNVTTTLMMQLSVQEAVHSNFDMIAIYLVKS